MRTGNTLEAIDRLEQAGCLTLQERAILEENYAFLRKIEHRLQIMFDLQTHTLPGQRRGIAAAGDSHGISPTGRIGRRWKPFKATYRQKTELNRRILDHLLHDAVRAETKQVEPETDLVLDPNPLPETIQRSLAAARLPQRARRLRQSDGAGRENDLVPVDPPLPALPGRRSLRSLLQAIAATPDPDATLVNLSKVSDSLGGKGVLWELFSFNPPSLQLYVRLCASSPYLSGILTSNPGMIDELMDSLVLDKLPTFADVG